MEDNEILDYLVRKWELLWNHYKLQNEMLEKRRTFLWIIQSILFYGWYQSLNDKIYLSFLIVVFGIFINIAWIIILKRDVEAVFITEESIRDTESQFNSLSKSKITFDRFLLEQKCLHFGGLFQWPYSKGKFGVNLLGQLWKIDDDNNFIKNFMRFFYHSIESFLNEYKIRPIRIWMTWLVPLAIFIVWIFLTVITLLKIGVALRLTFCSY